ncbi:MAG: NeuD/PglB/VioB family sugar acetyltransferase, partial [Acidaminobacteraceae bacterium]
MKKDIYIIGAGGVGSETVQLIKDINKVNYTWNLCGFLDENQSLKGNLICDVEVIGFINELKLKYKKNDEINFVCSVSNPRVKKILIDKLILAFPNAVFPTLIHPTSKVFDYTSLGKGVIIQANVIVSTNCVIGDYVQINPQCGIGHDCTIKDYSSLYWNVNLSGHVTIEKNVLMGSKSSVIQSKVIGEGSTVGMASLVLNDVGPG